MTKAQKAERDAQRTALRATLTPGETIYTTLRHRARSGMSRTISAHVIRDGALVDITHAVSVACGYRLDRNRWGVVMGGCGMDMGYALAYAIGAACYPDGVACIGAACASNDHNNREKGPEDGSPWIHRDGGYTFRHRWI